MLMWPWVSVGVTSDLDGVISVWDIQSVLPGGRTDGQLDITDSDRSACVGATQTKVAPDLAPGATTCSKCVFKQSSGADWVGPRWRWKHTHTSHTLIHGNSWTNHRSDSSDTDLFFLSFILLLFLTVFRLFPPGLLIFPDCSLCSLPVPYFNHSIFEPSLTVSFL